MYKIFTNGGRPLWPPKDLIRFAMRISCFYIFLVTLSIQLLLAKAIKGQALDEINVVLEIKNGTLQQVLDRIESQTGLTFAYLPEDVAAVSNITLGHDIISVAALLNKVLKGRGLAYRHLGNSVIIFPGENGETKTNKGTEASFGRALLMITGTVTEGTGSPLPAVNIIVKGTSKGTTTDSEGKYFIEADGSDVLVFTFIGYKTFEIPINGRSVIDVAMQLDATELSEVEVNAGYWNVKDRERTGNISRVPNEEIVRQPVTNPLTALEGRMPGVYIQQTSGVPGSAINVQIRGRNSLANGNDPLYIIDGVPFVSQKLSNQFLSNIFLSNGISPLNSINPSDIESIEVLKDADATAIYGSRGANGVVLITTKKGKGGKTTLDVNMYSGVGKVTRMLDLLSTKEYLEVRHEGFKNDNLVPSPDPNDWQNYAPDILLWDTTRYTDWQKELIGGTAKTTNIQASLTGGNESTKFHFSGGYYKETTVFPGDQAYKKGSMHLSVAHASTDKRLNSSISMSFVNDKNNLPFNDFTPQAWTLPPNAPALYDNDGKINWEKSTWTNPLSELENEYEGVNNNLITNAVFGYEILRDLVLKTSFGYNVFYIKELSVYPSAAFDPAFGLTSKESSSRTNRTSIKSWIIEPQISWGKKISIGKFSVIFGSTFQDQQTDQFAMQARGFASNSLIKNTKSATNLFVLSDDNSIYRYNGFFGRINFNLKEKYILNLTGRRDGSSRFGPEKRMANFGAVGVAWVFSNEEFLVNSGFLSFGKLRASYGTSGNDQIGNYKFLDTYSSIEPYQGMNTLIPAKLFNPDLAWEVNRKFEVGLDVAFLDDRISVLGSYFNNRSSNQLVNYKLPLITGFNSIQQNLDAIVENTGLEIELQTQNVKKGLLSWSTSINITFPRNELVRFPGLESSAYANQFVIGEPLTIVRRYHSLGVDPETGLYLFEDMNLDGAISSADRLYVKNIGQKYFGGVNNTVKIQGFQLDVFFQFVKQTAINYWGFDAAGALMYNHAEFILDRWQAEGDVKPIQRLAAGFESEAPTTASRFSQSDATITDASFIRLKNVSLSYELPDKWLRKVKGRLYMQGQNIVTITNYKGSDPESQNNNRLAPLQVWTMGMQVTF